MFNFVLTVVMILVSSQVWAEGEISTQSASSSVPMNQLIIFGVIFLLMYFLMIRPQSKKNKEHNHMLQNLNQGDEVMTTGGIMGKIIKIKDQFVVIIISKEVEITLQKQAITSMLPKGTLKNI